MIRKIEDAHEKKNISTHILLDLPEWFGLPESTESYIRDSQAMPFWCYEDHHTPLGFIALKETSPDTCEIFVMGVLKKHHQQGIGASLIRVYEEYAREKGYSYSQVKTVQMGHYDTYDGTNRFYYAMGYRELECFPDMWDEWNPCSIYVKRIKF